METVVDREHNISESIVTVVVSGCRGDVSPSSLLRTVHVSFFGSIVLYDLSSLNRIGCTSTALGNRIVWFVT